MNFLLDTNIVIPLEPTPEDDLARNTNMAMEFHRLSAISGNTTFIHPTISEDIKRDKNVDRQKHRQTVINRYPSLKYPPDATSLDPNIIKPAPHGTNDWVDNSLLAALNCDLVDYLITEDIGIHKKAKRLNLELRTLFLCDAIALLRDLFDISPKPPPTVEEVFVYQLDTSDPIFNSLRADYAGFDNWLTKCRKEHRKAFVIKSRDTGKLAGLAIFNREKKLPNGQNGKILKICTFKVSGDNSGNKLGELLLKPLFEHIDKNDYEYCYFTAYKKQRHLVSFAHDFGFYEIENLDSSKELALCKRFIYTTSDIETYTPLDFHIQYGPRVTSFNNNKSFIVPIRPKFHSLLFPELNPPSLFPEAPRACGNSIRKAYLSNANTKLISPGDNLFFYRSQYGSKQGAGLTCFGIVEEILRSYDPADIARFVGKRTVYSIKEIQELSGKSEILAILFRFILPLKETIPLRILKKNSIIKAQPQSISQMQEPAIQWIRQYINM